MKALSLSAMPDLMQGVTPRHLLLLSAGILFCIGLVMVASASMGVAEAQFSGMVNTDYKDVFAFGLLVTILIFRPQGLLGRPQVSKV